MYGKRARLGVIVPSVNSVMEPDIRRMMPWDSTEVAVYTARMGSSGTTHGPETLTEMTSSADTAARDLSTVADVIAYGCTSGSFLNGPQWDVELIARLEELSGKPVTTTSTALVRGLRMLNVQRIVIATPYPPGTNERMVTYFTAQGFDVLDIEGLGVTQFGGQGHYEPQAAYDLAFRLDRPDADAVVISCTNFRAIDIIDSLERTLGKPVLTSNQATLWDLLRLKGVDDPVPGFGQLLSLGQRAAQLTGAA